MLEMVMQPLQLTANPGARTLCGLPASILHRWLCRHRPLGNRALAISRPPEMTVSRSQAFGGGKASKIPGYANSLGLACRFV